MSSGWRPSDHGEKLFYFVMSNVVVTYMPEEQVDLDPVLDSVFTQMHCDNSRHSDSKSIEDVQDSRWV